MKTQHSNSKAMAAILGAVTSCFGLGLHNRYCIPHPNHVVGCSNNILSFTQGCKMQELCMMQAKSSSSTGECKRHSTYIASRKKALSALAACRSPYLGPAAFCESCGGTTPSSPAAAAAATSTAAPGAAAAAADAPAACRPLLKHCLSRAACRSSSSADCLTAQLEAGPSLWRPGEAGPDAASGPVVGKTAPGSMLSWCSAVSGGQSLLVALVLGCVLGWGSGTGSGASALWTGCWTDLHIHKPLAVLVHKHGA